MLGRRQTYILREAARRFMRFNDVDESITDMWTGLGSASAYKPVSPKYMVVATDPNPGYTTWWKLTSAGAEIVQNWIDDGLTAKEIEK